MIAVSCSVVVVVSSKYRAPAIIRMPATVVTARARVEASGEVLAAGLVQDSALGSARAWAPE